ncbi:MAG: PAS domain S-box protein [Xanthomonadaceae bacterium]|nr:PAS domain S-box protein [Xanthomonadaceae bacterium]
MNKSKSISRLVSTFMVLLILLAVGSLGYLLISEKYARFHQEMDTFQENFTASQKNQLKNQVNQAIDYIDHKLSQIEILARQELKQRVDESLQIATTIHQQYQHQRPDTEIRQLIKTTLGAIRFDHGLGYYFILDADGVFQLNPNLPTVEGVSLNDLKNNGGPDLMARFREIASGSGEGFNNYRFQKPGQQKPDSKSPKTTFIKHFAPYNWYLGTGVYLDDMEKTIQNQMNDYLNIHRFGLHNQNYVFVIKLLDIKGGKKFGIMYANASRPDLIGKYISDDFADAKGKLFRREFLQGLRDKGQCFVSYWYKNIGNNLRPQLKTTFFKLYKKADLIVAAGAYHPDMGKVIAGYQNKLEKNITKDVRNIIIILLLIFTALLIIVRFMSHKISQEFTVFSNFFAKAAQQNQQIDSHSLSLKEFQTLAATVNQMIAQRQLVERSLHDSKEKFRTLAATSPTAIFIHQQGTFVYANPAVCKITGYRIEEILRMKFWEIVHPDMRGKIKSLRFQQKAGETIPQRYEVRIVTKQGVIKWIDFSAASINFNGKLEIMGNAIDITERKQAEQDLLAEKERLAVTLSSIGDGVMATDLAGKITLMNKAAEQITGWTADIALGRKLAVVLSVTTENNSESPVDLLQQVQKNGTPCYRQKLVSIYAKDGGEKIIADSAAPIQNQDGKTIGIIVVIRDITEKVRTRKELETAQKLESIGLLAGGIAHDFNNLLTAIYGNISLAKMYPDDKNKVFHYLDKTENSLAQAKGLTQQLLTFAKGGSPVKQLVTIGPQLEEVAKFSLRGSKTNLQTDIAADLWPVKIDTGQFSQVINNLAMNANQAMPGGGILSIKAENFLLSPAERLQGRKNNHYIKITVADQGIGISKNYLDKIFDPYFTTKHKGSGLGLATVYSIIKNHHGHIKVESEPGKGTTFSILLPASETMAETNMEVPASIEIGQTGSGKILIMDDEEVVREICGEMLLTIGYSVDYAVNGQEVLEKYQQAMREEKPFDLVIMDLTIPGGMGGKEAIKKLLKIDPQAKAIVSSGYSHDDVMANYQDYGFQGVAAKPYLLSDLNKVIKSLTH